jgi:hypothetical protein
MESSNLTNISQGSDRAPIFKSAIEEASAGAMMGAGLGGMVSIVLGGILGRVGEKVGESIGLSGTLGGCFVVWCLFLLLPLVLILNRHQWLLGFSWCVAGAAYLWGLHGWIDRKDIGIIYPWVLSTLPFGICLGAFYEPIRLARGGETDSYKTTRVHVSSSFIYVGRRNYFVDIARLLAFVISLINRHRPGAMFAGAFCGGLTAFLIGALVASRGDAAVTNLFGSTWNIAYASAGMGALSGGGGGWFAWSIRDRQNQTLHELAPQVIGESPKPPNSGIRA